MNKNFYIFQKILISVVVMSVPVAFPAVSFGDADTTAAVNALNGEMVKQFGVEIGHMANEVARLDSEIANLNSFSLDKGNTEINSELDKIKDQLSDLKNVQDQFQATFPGYDKYAEEKDPEKEKDYLERYKNMVDSTQKALTNVTNEMASLNDPSRIQAEQAALNGIKQDISGAEGTKAAVQGLAELDSQIISQIQMLRQQMAAQSAAQNTYYAAQVQRDADIRTEVSKMIGNGDQKIENYLDNNPLDLPSFDS